MFGINLNPIDWEHLPQEIIDAIEDTKEDYDFVGVRIQESSFDLGPIYHTSHIWVDGEDTGEELPGICAVSASNINKMRREASWYFGDHVAIIASYYGEWGEDTEEIILRDAEVVKILC